MMLFDIIYIYFLRVCVCVCRCVRVCVCVCRLIDKETGDASDVRGVTSVFPFPPCLILLLLLLL